MDEETEELDAGNLIGSIGGAVGDIFGGLFGDDGIDGDGRGRGSTPGADAPPTVVVVAGGESAPPSMMPVYLLGAGLLAGLFLLGRR